MAVYVRDRVDSYDSQAEAAQAFGVSRTYLLRVMANGRYGRKILQKLNAVAVKRVRTHYEIEEPRPRKQVTK